MSTLTANLRDSQRSGRVRWSPGFVNWGMGLLILLIIVPLALRAAQPAPPQIAEFSPQANQIKEAPVEQNANTGKNGAGGTGVSPPPGSPSPSSGTDVLGNTGRQLDEASVRHCVGTPARQIEDPQSPPCVPYFNGPNGGATSKGVSGDSIKVAVPTGFGQDDATLLAFFNRRFEMYGRKLVFVPYSANQTPGPPDMVADAHTVDSKGVFADLGYAFGSIAGKSVVFYDELANRGVLSVAADCCELMNGGDQHMERKAPYEWNYVPSSDKILSNYTDMVCQNLVGKPATYAAPPQSLQPKRIFAVLRYTYPDGSPQVDQSIFVRGVKACGGGDVVTQEWSGDRRETASMMLSLEQSKVTSILCLCHSSDLSLNLMQDANSNGYNPEWLISNMMQQDSDAAATYFPPGQNTHVIGLMSLNKTQPLDSLPMMWAGKEIDANYVFGGDAPQYTYYNLLVLASGIQMAGPHLTPQSFQDALYRTRFPNPGAAGPPYYQATVGFGPGNHTMVQDLAPVWWSPSSRSVVATTPGAYCFVDLGERFGAGSWPAGIQFMDSSRPCR